MRRCRVRSLGFVVLIYIKISVLIIKTVRLPNQKNQYERKQLFYVARFINE